MNPETLARLRTPGALLAFIGSILILIPQAYMVQWYLAWASFLPLLPPQSVPAVQFALQLLLASIAVAIVSGSGVLVGAALAATRRGALGGFLSLAFATPAFIVTGVLGWIGAALAIVGGMLALLSGVRPPPKEGKRKATSP